MCYNLRVYTMHKENVLSSGALQPAVSCVLHMMYVRV
jgi:hypothetical protein